MDTADEKVIFSCPNCGKKYDAQLTDVGKKGNCSNCNSRISVPNPATNNPSKHLLETAFLVIRIVAIGLLLWAYAKHPIGYYELLSVVVCATCAYGAYYARELGRAGWKWTMAVVVVLFNPIFPFYPSRDEWEVIDAIAAATLLLSIPLLRPLSKPVDKVWRSIKSYLFLMFLLVVAMIVALYLIGGAIGTILAMILLLIIFFLPDLDDW